MDHWPSYTSLHNYKCYAHREVNHSVKFVNPETGVHTQNIERLWRDMRANILRYGVFEIITFQTIFSRILI